MIEWDYLIVITILNLMSGLLSFTASMYVFNKYFLPKIMADMGTSTVKTLSKDPEIKPFIDKTKLLLEKLEPIIEKFRNLDIEKLQDDLKPMVEAFKRIDPNTLDEILSNVKGLTGNLAKKTEKPKIPKPD